MRSVSAEKSTWPGGVEEGDGGVGGVDDGGFGEDGDAACAFHGVDVEEGVAVVYAAGFTQLAGGVRTASERCGFCLRRRVRGIPVTMRFMVCHRYQCVFLCCEGWCVLVRGCSGCGGCAVIVSPLCPRRGKSPESRC